MGKAVTFASLAYEEIADGVKKAAITTEPKEMLAEVLRLAPGRALTGDIAQGTDRYFYTLTGEVSVARDGRTQKAAADSFITLQEGAGFTVTNTGAGEAELLSVVAPPRGNGARTGFAGGITVAQRDAVPVVHVPEQRKRRLHFVDAAAAPSDRAHAMIVLYDTQTVTGLHMHPNAESMFVVLTGKVRFTVNGEPVVLERGQAVHFPAGDRHGLTREGGDVSFLEFHIPGGYTTVRG
jgi:mannose-6-phosphate isomerase-like protein (cupin superfamily)